MGRSKKKRKGHLKTKKTSYGKTEKLHPEAESVYRILQSHDAVCGKVEKPEPLKEGGFRIKFDMKVSLPSRANTRGISETGVRAQEPVTLLFPPTYPFHAPIILLRSDFNKSLPHLNPIFTLDEEDYVLPCVYDGPLSELLHQEGDGLSEIMNQLSDWLGKAAINDLINPRQGWEPIRRDDTFGWMVYDLSGLRKLVQNREGALVFPCRFWKERCRQKDSFFIFGIDPDTPQDITPWLIKNSFYAQKGPGITLYSSLMIFVWSNSEAVIDQYLPEDIQNLHQLYQRAEDYGCYDPLHSTLINIGWAYKEASLNISRFPLFVILCARRPYALIGDTSPLELIPYVIECQVVDERSPFLEEAIQVRKDSPVLPLGHRHPVNSGLLRRMSGGKEDMNNGHIIHIGCGSIGSKIAIHLARSGHGPFKLIDKSAFSPHNVARHALIPIPEIPGQPKASLLAHEIKLLNLEAEPINDDIIELCKHPDNKITIFPDDSRLIIESTGSMAVREMLASLPPKKLPGRLLHGALYEQGKVAILALEGSRRNPNVNDLVIRFWDERIDNPELNSKFISSDGTLSRQETGLGCGSYTMVLPDSRISLFTAGMAERARQILENGSSQNGELWIGMLDEHEIGVIWRIINVGQTTVLKARAQNHWEIRILKEALHLMSQDIKTWGEVETGGVLIGRISLSRRCFTVSRVIEAPPDSYRSKNSFILGIQGLRKKVKEICDKSGGILNYVGTWHSHPKGGETSLIDKASIGGMRRLRFGAPAIGLICLPSGFRVIIDEGKLA